MGRDAFARQSLGNAFNERVKKTRVLMVGAGGIGCELLKNLVLMSFGEVHVVDLDTIDLSNLNRQFLFRHEHIKQPKAVVAKNTASKFNPAVKIVAYHANIKDAQFTKKWFRQFDIVFNALDNMEARRYVNTMCIALDLPLVESGTTGFRGQASVIKRGITECYECVPKETPKTFPVCTIRSTPSQPIHCIVWAKSYLLAEIFGEGSDDTKELDFSSGAENSNQELDDIRKETEALKKIRTSIGTHDFVKLVFEKVFTTDIEVLRSIPERWSKARPAPMPLSFDDLESQSKSSTILKSLARDQAVWDLKDCFTIYKHSLERLVARKLKTKQAVIDFDKDDDDTLEFVSAAANLRSYIFGIEPKSKFDIKQMAGNIIPAIATTNAIIAGACVLQAFKILRDEYPKAKKWYMWQSTDRVMASTFDRPAPDCAVCSVARTDAVVSAEATLEDLVTALVSDVGLTDADEFSILANDQIIFEQGDEDFEDNLPSPLSSFNLGAFVDIKSDTKEDLVLSIDEPDESSDKPIAPVTIKRITLSPKKAQLPKSPTLAVRTNGAATTHDSTAKATTTNNGDSSSKKRAAEDALDHGPAKKVQTVFELDDDGAIVFD